MELIDKSGIGIIEVFVSIFIVFVIYIFHYMMTDGTAVKDAENRLKITWIAVYFVVLFGMGYYKVERVEGMYSGTTDTGIALMIELQDGIASMNTYGFPIKGTYTVHWNSIEIKMSSWGMQDTITAGYYNGELHFSDAVLIRE